MFLKRLFMFKMLFILGLGLFLFASTPASAHTIRQGINADKYAPTGDPSVSYPQISLRTNRTPERTDLNDIIYRADKAASQFPIGEQDKRAQAVLKELTSYFGSGRLGHA